MPRTFKKFLVGGWVVIRWSIVILMLSLNFKLNKNGIMQLYDQFLLPWRPLNVKQPSLFFSCLLIASCYVNVTRFCAILAKSNIGDCFRADCEEKLLLSKQFLFLLLNFLFQVLLSVQPWKFHDKTLYKVWIIKKLSWCIFTPTVN